MLEQGWAEGAGRPHYVTFCKSQCCREHTPSGLADAKGTWMSF